MSKFLLLYGTQEGQTEKIAQAMGHELSNLGHVVELRDARTARAMEHGEFEGVIVGGSVHGGRFSESLRAWISANRAELELLPTAFFSVCLGILQGDSDSKVAREERRIVARLFEETQWRPDFFAIFAGALPYSRYGWFKKRMMRSIARKAGVETDLHLEYEYTDWEQVKRFAREFVERQAHRDGKIDQRLPDSPSTERSN